MNFIITFLLSISFHSSVYADSKAMYDNNGLTLVYGGTTEKVDSTRWDRTMNGDNAVFTSKDKYVTNVRVEVAYEGNRIVAVKELCDEGCSGKGMFTEKTYFKNAVYKINQTDELKYFGVTAAYCENVKKLGGKIEECKETLAKLPYELGVSFKQTKIFKDSYLAKHPESELDLTLNLKSLDSLMEIIQLCGDLNKYSMKNEAKPNSAAPIQESITQPK